MSSSKKELDTKVLWFKTALSIWLDRHAIITRITSSSKKLWNKEVAQSKKIWAKRKKRLDKSSGATKDLKNARNGYYHIIRKAKREC